LRARPDAAPKYIEEGLALSGKLPFQFIRVIALAAGSWFFSHSRPGRQDKGRVYTKDSAEEPGSF
jgi:hypothetical protein